MMDLLWCILYLAVIGTTSHYIGQALPRQWFHAERFPYRLYGWEKDGEIYQKVKIRAWKDKVPDMSKIMPDMVPKKVSSFPTPESVQVLIAETCVAELIHNLLMILGFVCCAIWRGLGGFAVSVCYVLGNIPSIMIQRFNRPHLLRVHEKLVQRQSAQHQ